MNVHVAESDNILYPGQIFEAAEANGTDRAAGASEVVKKYAAKVANDISVAVPTETEDRLGLLIRLNVTAHCYHVKHLQATTFDKISELLDFDWFSSLFMNAATIVAAECCDSQIHQLFAQIAAEDSEAPILDGLAVITMTAMADKIFGLETEQMM